MVVSHFPSLEKWCLSRIDLINSRPLVFLEDLLVIVDPPGGPFLVGLIAMDFSIPM